MKKQGTIRRLDAALGAGLLLAMLITPLAGFGQRCAQVRQEVLRLHILANSDSEADQALKLRVRDAVLRRPADFSPPPGRWRRPRPPPWRTCPPSRPQPAGRWRRRGAMLR